MTVPFTITGNKADIAFVTVTTNSVGTSAPVSAIIPKDYSRRNATTGEIRVARSAGISVASSTTSTISIIPSGAEAKVRTSVESGQHQRRPRERFPSQILSSWTRTAFITPAISMIACCWA